MSADQNGAAGETSQPAPNQTAEDLVAQVESGPRNPKAQIAVVVIIALSVAWSLFQLYIAQRPINSFIARSWHLGFALALVYLAYPAYDFHNPPGWVRGLRAVLPFLRNARSNRDHIPIFDILLAILASAGALFIWWDFDGIIARQGLPSELDVWMGVITMVLLLEAARRALGPALSIICIVFIIYAFVGPWMPEILRHRGIPLDFFINDMYMSTTGIFGVPLGVSTRLRLPVRAFRGPARQGRCRQVFHRRRLRRTRPSHRRTGQGRRGRLRIVGPGLRLVDRQYGDHRHLHHSSDEEGGTARLQGRCRRSGRVDQRPADAADHGRRRLHHGRHHWHSLSRCGARGAVSGDHLLHGAVLCGSPGGTQAQPEAIVEKRTAAPPQDFPQRVALHHPAGRSHLVPGDRAALADLFGP